MLGNCLVRNPMTSEGTLDAGAICEALLFFSKMHVVLDQGTLALFANGKFLEPFIEMLKRGYLTASYAPELPVLYSETVGGLRQHLFTVVRTGGNQQQPLKRSPDILLFNLKSLLDDDAKARSYHRDLCRLISFKSLEGGPTIAKAAEDIRDPAFAREIAIMSLLRFGVPSDQIKFSRMEIIPTEPGKFVVDTDIDFQRLKKYSDELGTNMLFPGVGDARLDISLAASQNASMIGNSGNQRIVEMILLKAIGAVRTPTAPREIYDFISLDTPSVREVINRGERTPKELIDLLESAHSFKKWLNAQDPNKDLIQEMLREKTSVGWLETIPAKAVRFGLFKAGSYLADAFVPGLGMAVGAVDRLLIDKLAQRWRPHFFVENQLRGFLDGRVG